MDRVLQDAVYGEGNMQDEEQMERHDTDDQSGWGIRSSLRRARRLAKRGVTAPVSAARRGLRAGLRKFVPNRDAAKAKLVRNLYRKLWFEHSNWLAQQDKAAGVPLKTRAEYETVSKLWAKNEIAKQRLPLKYTADPATNLAADIMGSDVMGTWWNPFSWFQSQVNVVVNNTRDQRADQAPDEQSSQIVQPGDMSTDVQDPGAQQYQDDGSDQAGWNGIRNLKGPGISGEDTLGAFIGEVLNREQPARDNPNVDEIVRNIVAKLRAGQAISPGEIGLLSSAAKEGNERARKVVLILKTRGAVVSGDDSGLDPWMYKLNPGYWFASSRKKEFIDKEKKGWKENASLREQLEKQRKELDAAEKAASAADAVAQAKAQAAETEARLKAIADSLKGSISGSFVGHEKKTPISDVVLAALDKTGKREAADQIYAKIREGEELTPEELREARQIARIVGRVRVVHGGLVNDKTTAAVHGAFVGACAVGGITVALDQNLKQQKAADLLAQKVASGQPLRQEERDGLARVLRRQQKLDRFAASLVSGRALAGCPKSWSRGAFVGAARASSPENQKMLSAIVKLAKVGNPRAQRALAALRKTGEISGGSGVGLSLSSAFKYATAPVWLPAKGIYKGGKWTGQKLGIISRGGSSPEQVRLNRLRAAQKRAAAAQARARAADAQNEAEYRAQQAVAAAADAEADAADAEATAKEQAMKTAEVEAAPDLQPGAADDSSEGAFIGAWTALVGKDTRRGKAVAKAGEKSPAGQKVRGAAVVFARAKRGDPKARKAIEVMVAKAKQGDQQAIRDVNAMQVARHAYEARAAAKKQVVATHREKTRQSRMKANEKKFTALQKRFEARTAERLARMERKRRLQSLAKVERRAAAGNPKARAVVARKVALAKKGDKKAQAEVKGMKLARAVRQHTSSRTERKNMRAAQHLAQRIQANDPAAIRQYNVIKDAAARGNPNARRGLQRLALAGAVTATVATGIVVLPKVVAKKDEKKSRKKPVPGTPQFAQAKEQVEKAKERAVAGTASREELVAKARLANDIGDKQAAGVLALASASAPSATEGLKKAASTAAAAQAGNTEAKAKLDSDLAAARQGDTTAINRMGQVAAAQTVAAVESGQPVPQAMRDAVNLQERARQGDPAAQTTLQRVSEAATSPDPTPEATAAAVYATGAAALASSLASRPRARQELMEKVNPPVPKGEQSAAQAQLAAIVARTNEGTVTAAEGQQGIELAMRLHQPRVAAEISAKAPPLDIDAMSSLPDSPLPPIAGVWELIKATLKALTFTTANPLANYQEGVAARSRDAVTVTGGWSPFSLFAKAGPSLPTLAMLSAPVSATAAVASLMKNRKGAPAPVAKASPAVSPQAPKTESSEIPTASAGSDDDFRTLVSSALKTKKISRRDLDRAVDANPVSRANPTARKALADQVRKFLEEHKVVVSGEDGRDGVNQLLQKAVASHVMSRADFNRAVKLQCGPDSSPSKKKEFGARTLKFLAGRKVVVSGDESSPGDVKVFKVALTRALEEKKMSRDDFNKTVAANLGPAATKDEKTLAAARLLRFLEKRGVKVV